MHYIDLFDLSSFLKSKSVEDYKFDGHHYQIIEEVVFLSANKNFISDILSARLKIQKRFPDLILPTDNIYKAKQILRLLYISFYEEYKTIISDLISEYKLLPDLYWRDKIFSLNRETEKLLDDHEFSGDKITKDEANSIALDSLLEDVDLDLLDNIIICNKPFNKADGFPFWINPFLTRKTNELMGLRMEVLQNPIPYLNIGFPIYASLIEMQKMLKENYQAIQDFRVNNIQWKDKRDHRKDNLPKMIDAYLLDKVGKDKLQISIELEKEYGTEISFEAVGQLIKRFQDEANKMGKKQET